MSTITTTTVGELQIGDKLLLPETPRRDPITVEVAILRPTRSGRVHVWVRSTHQQRTLLSPWRYGTFPATAPIERVED